MNQLQEIILELIRPGPSHNQLLSPTTQYTAICGSGEPITFSIDMEQHELMDIIARLRYSEQDGAVSAAIPDAVRQATVKEVGYRLRAVFGKLTNFIAEEGRAFGQLGKGNANGAESLIHLRLVSSASELSYVPFEMAIAPTASPSEGRQMFIDSTLPIVITREIRRSKPVPTSWNPDHPIKVLMIAAQPGFLRVPLDEHLRALRESLAPWVTREDDEQKQFEALKARLRVLPNASLKEIYEICATDKFTHVHILAHGGECPKAREQRFGIILCNADDKSEKHYVSASQLVKALQAETAAGDRRSAPQMVSLATCDSGSQGSLLIPGGSIAHELHLAGIPVVVASQFPLTKPGSVKLISELYPRILRGDDPRHAMFEVRRILCMLDDRNHDWASLVMYVSLSPEFPDQVKAFFEKQCKGAIDTLLGFADREIADGPRVALKDAPTATAAGNHDQEKVALEKVERWLAIWKTRLETARDIQSRVRRAEYYGVRGATYKRVAMLYANRVEIWNEDCDNKKQFTENLQIALKHYQSAIDEWATDESKFHWVATQALSVKVFLQATVDQREQYAFSTDDYVYFQMAFKLAELDSALGETNRSRAWGFGTVAELALIGTLFEKTAKVAVARTKTNFNALMNSACEALVSCVGTSDFAAESTVRQFRRYVALWNLNSSKLKPREIEAKQMAEEAVRVLTGGQ